MNKSIFIWMFLVIALICVSLNVNIQSIYAILYDNGTCTNGNVTKGANQVINRNRSMDNFFRNLTRDNRQLADLMCQNMLNETTAR
jgi:hypothetical protein